MNAISFSLFRAAHHKIRGRNEFEIYKNFVTDHSNSFITSIINQRFESELKGKDDVKSQQFRKEGNEDYKNGDYKESAIAYNKSLCYATYNSEAYATTLANRSAVFFQLGDYEGCIKDIDLCLKAVYPEALRPKVYIRKAECYQKLGDPLKMRTVLLDVLNVIDSMEPLLKPIAENYRKTVKELLTKEADAKKDETNRFDKLPILDANPSFLGASTAIELRHTRRTGTRVVAKKEIAPGGILFVEKAYAFICYNDSEKFSSHCQNCLKKADSCVPCKGCVEHLYCSEECRDTAWNDFHQWDCTAFQAKLFTIETIGPMSARVLFKGLQTGLPMNKVYFENGVINNYGNSDDNYPYMFSLPTNIEKIDKATLELFALAAETFVVYLKLKTDFFNHLKKWPAYANKSNKELTNKIGGLIIRHIAQLHRSEIQILKIEDGFPIRSVTVGAAVCPSLAMATHSCKPNTTHYFLGDTVVVKAIENIKPNEEIHYAYRGIDHEHLPNFKQRQMKLLKECFLNCKCRVCTNPKMSFGAHDAYICVKCSGPLLGDWKFGFLPVGTCLDCNYECRISAEVVFKESLVLQNLAEFDMFNDLEDANQGLQLAKTIYQPYHRVIRDFYQELAKYHLRTAHPHILCERGVAICGDCCDILGNLKCHMDMQKVVIECHDKYYGNLSLLSGAIRFTYCFICLQWLKDNLVNRYSQVGEILGDLKNRIEEVKVIMDLYFPPFLGIVAKLEKLILELQITGVTQEVYNMHLDCFKYDSDYE